MFNTAYGVVKAGKPFSDYELICEIQVKNGLDLGENYRNINGCKTFAASIAQTLVDKQVKFQILSYKLGLGKSLTGLGLKKFKKTWAWARPKYFSTPALALALLITFFFVFHGLKTGFFCYSLKLNFICYLNTDLFTPIDTKE